MCHECFSLGKEDVTLDNIRSRRTKVGNIDVNYYFGGQGDPLIVLHGGASGSEAWMKTVSELTKNFAVYLPDLPGFGHSQSIDGDYYIPELVEFVDNFSHHIGVESFHLVGHSIGGGVALNYVLKFPGKVKKLVLISSMCLGREISWWIRLLSHPALIRSIGRAAIGIFRGVKWVAGKLFTGLKLVFPFSKASILIGSSVTTLKEQTMVLVDRLSEIMVPTLVVWGAKDPIVPVRQAYAAAQLIPCCQLKVFEGCGHSVYRQRIQGFSQLVTGFLS